MGCGASTLKPSGPQAKCVRDPFGVAEAASTEDGFQLGSGHVSTTLGSDGATSTSTSSRSSPVGDPKANDEATLASVRAAILAVKDSKPLGHHRVQDALKAFQAAEGISLQTCCLMQQVLTLVAAQSGARSAPEAELKTLLETLGVAAWRQFSQWCMEQSLMEAFRLVDLKQKSKIAAEELMVLLMLISVQRDDATSLDPKDAEHIVQDFDVFGDGCLSEFEFLNMVRSLARHVQEPKEDSRFGGQVLNSKKQAVSQHLVLYFDVNNTVLISDTVTGQGEEDLLSIALAGSAWGIRTPRSGEGEGWILVCPEPKSSPPWEGLLTYAEFVFEEFPLPPPGNYQRTEAVKERRRTCLRRFCNPGQPGEALHPYLTRMLARLRKPWSTIQAREPVISKTSDDLMVLLPSFYLLLIELKRAKRSFTIVFRTFGVDIDATMEAEFNAFCEGRHPQFPGVLKFDGSDGGLDYRMNLQDPSSLGTFFRNPEDGGISLIWGTHVQPPSGAGLEYYENFQNLEIHVGVENVFDSLQRRVLGRSQTVMLRDYYPGWAQAQFSGVGGKPVFIHAEDATIMPIFFDDHIRPVDPTIVDAIDPRDFPRRVPMPQVFNIHLVRATALRSIMEANYFIDEVARCEEEKRLQLQRQSKVAGLLHDSASVRKVIQILGGKDKGAQPEPDVCASESIRFGNFKFTKWKEIEEVRHSAPLSPRATDEPTTSPRGQTEMSTSFIDPSPTRSFSRQSRQPSKQSRQASKRGNPIQEPCFKNLSATSRSLVPVKLQHEDTKTRFLQNEWAPFVDDLRKQAAEIRRRRASGFSDHEVMLPQAALVDLSHRCLALTQKWHGRANLSSVYEFLMDAAESDGHSLYLFGQLPQERSRDGYVRVLDGQTRQKLYNTPTAHGQKAGKRFIGCLRQEAGESPIDNLVLPSVMHRHRALLLKVGHRIQQFFLKVLQKRQKAILLDFGVPVEQNNDTPTFHQIRLLMQQQARKSLAHWMLDEYGTVLESYGQLPDDVRELGDKFLHERICSSIQRREEEAADDDMEAFLLHCDKHPGRAFRSSNIVHKLMLFKAMADPAVRILWRSDLECFTQHRYFAVSWRRSVPLLALPAEYEGGQGSRLCTLRAAGAIEQTRFRKNIFAYGEAHGLGQGGGGCAEGLQWKPGTLMYEFGTLLCEDEMSKVPNHWVTDIEKIVHDTVILCPEGGDLDALPGETLHDVGQNPVASSSIGPTQHVQVTRAGVDDFPLMAESYAPWWRDDLNAWIDLVPVGNCEDAFFVQVRSATPWAVPLLLCLIHLRARLLEVFARTVDFSVTCHPTVDGEFILNIAPVACIKKIFVPKGEGCMGLDFDFHNPDTDERVTSYRLPAACVDCSHGKGNILALTDELWHMSLEGRPVLARLYDFNRKPGARALVESYFRA